MGSHPCGYSWRIAQRQQNSRANIDGRITRHRYYFRLLVPERRFTQFRAKDLQLGVAVRFEPLDQNEIDRLHTGKQARQIRLLFLKFVQQSPPAGRGDEYFMRAREAMAMAVLAGFINVELVMDVLDGGHCQA